jgi:hypothetical protein
MRASLAQSVLGLMACALGRPLLQILVYQEPTTVLMVGSLGIGKNALCGDDDDDDDDDTKKSAAGIFWEHGRPDRQTSSEFVVAAPSSRLNRCWRTWIIRNSTGASLSKR